MYNIVLVVHILLCIFMIVVVLLQQGKGAELGATFSGGSNTLFGAGGASTLLSRITTVSAIMFMLTSIILVKHYPAQSLADLTDSGSGLLAPMAESAPETPAAEGTEAAPAAAAATGSEAQPETPLESEPAN